MKVVEKVNTFATELSYIKDRSIKEFTKEAIKELPDYFFKLPASTSKKYHPSFAAGEGGLVRHTQSTVRMAQELFRVEMFDSIYDDEEKDIIISSLILHDGNKAGKEGVHTVTEHPILMSKFLKKPSLSGMIREDVLDRICKNIERHMGAWTTNRNGDEILDKPQSKMQKFVHLCDYIVSRKCVEMNLDTPLSN